MGNNLFAVETKELTRKFGSFTAVDKVTFQVKQGEVFGFLGANGAGKTTTIRILCGLLMPSSGEARVAGYDIYKDYEKVKLKIGYMSQKFSLYNDLTVKENIEFYGGVYGLSRLQIKDKTKELLEYLKLEKEVNTLANDLTLGWRQSLALSTAIIHDPEIIFLDEPTSGVDPISRRNFWSLIYDLANKGKTIFVTTHFMDEAEYCHRLSIMSEGKILVIDEPKNLKQKYQAKNMQEVFLRVSGR